MHDILSFKYRDVFLLFFELTAVVDIVSCDCGCGCSSGCGYSTI